jgi:hypothetical protein
VVSEVKRHISGDGRRCARAHPTHCLSSCHKRNLTRNGNARDEQHALISVMRHCVLGVVLGLGVPVVRGLAPIHQGKDALITLPEVWHPGMDEDTTIAQPDAPTEVRPPPTGDVCFTKRTLVAIEGDETGAPLEGADATEGACANACKTNPECHSFSFSEGVACWFKTRNASPLDDEAADAGGFFTYYEAHCPSRKGITASSAHGRV